MGFWFFTGVLLGTSPIYHSRMQCCRLMTKFLSHFQISADEQVYSYKTSTSVHDHSVCLVCAHPAHACTYLYTIPLNQHMHNTISRRDTCFWASRLICATRVWAKKLKDQEMAKHLLKQFKDVRVWSFLKTVMHFLCFANRYSSLSNSLTLLLTSQAGGCVFASLCLCFCFCTSLLALPSSSQFSDNETTSWHHYSAENDKPM